MAPPGLRPLGQAMVDANEISLAVCRATTVEEPAGQGSCSFSQARRGAGHSSPSLPKIQTYVFARGKRLLLAFGAQHNVAPADNQDFPVRHRQNCQGATENGRRTIADEL
jgi:hypothetical protein